jgi:hypothetical protein
MLRRGQWCPFAAPCFLLLIVVVFVLVRLTTPLRLPLLPDAVGLSGRLLLLRQ